ncbi:MAG: KEOPS complex subunit Pcc1 [Halobacteriaceae archaeon]
MDSHEAIFEFEYDDQQHASIIANSIRLEANDIEDSRATTTVHQDGCNLRVIINAQSVTTLRAGCNTWCSLIDVAESVAQSVKEI